MTASYELKYTDPYGKELKTLNKYVSFEGARKQNEIGKMEIILPANAYPFSLFVAGNDVLVDYRVEIYRRLESTKPTLLWETAWFLQDFNAKLDENGQEVYILSLTDSIELLDRRIIPYNEGMELLYADKVQEADDMMKAIMEENFGPTALDADRDLSDYIVIQGDSTQGPSLLKSFSRRKILQTLQEIAESSIEQGTVLIFDLVYRPDTNLRNFEFQTFIGYRGKDRSTDSSDPLIVSAETGSLANPDVLYEHSGSRNYVYAGGQSVGQIRAVAEVSDNEDIIKSPFNRREIFVNASDTDDADELEDEAQNELRKHKAVVTFSGDLVETPKVQYGKDFDYGWKLTAEYNKQSYDVYVDAISIKVDQNGEKVTAALRSTF